LVVWTGHVRILLTANHTGHRKKFIAVSLVLAVATVWVFAWGTREKAFNWRVFAASFGGLDAGWLGLALLCSYCTYVVRAIRWAVLIRPLRPKASLGNLFSATVIGFSAVTALGRAAEMVRPYLIAQKEGLPFSTQVAAWIVERLYDVLVALAVFGFALSQVKQSGVALGTTLSWALQMGGLVIGAGSAGCLAILVAMRFWSDQIRRGILRGLGFLAAHHLARVQTVVANFLDGVRCTKSQSATVLLILYTAVEWMLIAACYACVLRAFGNVVRFSSIDILILMGFVTFGSLVQLPAVGGGAQVTAVLVLTEIFAVPIEVATGMGLLLWFISFVAILPVGVLFGVREGLTWARIREAEEGNLA
jgi:uncharacterized protein (TIRG00374 family)